MERNLTTGSVFKNLLYFSLPYLLSYFMQTLYGTADMIIIGKFGSVSDITAVSIGSQFMHMITVLIVGIAMGSTVLIGRSVGAGDKREMRTAIGNSATLFVGLSLAVTVVLLLFTKTTVNILSTPAEAVRETAVYLVICFAGVPFITAYNLISSIFRGMGDSKSPMYFIAVSCVLNIALDIVLMGPLRLGPAGAALGTTVSQTVSVITALAVIIRKKSVEGLKKSDFRLRKRTVSEILRIGVPVGLQDGFIQIAFIFITIIANRRGLNDAAAVGITEKVIGAVFLVPSSMLSAVSALAAQNIGAEREDRARRTLWYSIAITVSYGLIIAVSVMFNAEGVISLFKNEPEVIRLGGQYLRGYIFDCVFAGIHFCFSGYFCALGRSGISFLHNFLSIVLMRVPGAYFASKMFSDTLFPMGCAAPLGSLLSVAVCAAAYVILTRKQRKA